MRRWGTVPRWAALAGLIAGLLAAVPARAASPPARRATGTSTLPNPVVNGSFELYADTMPNTEAMPDGGAADGELWWSEGYGSPARFENLAGDPNPDREAIIPPVSGDGISDHDFWQAALPPLPLVSLDFDALAFTLEAGTIPAPAEIQVGFELSPDRADPYAGVYWEGALRFTAAAMHPDERGRIRLAPATDASVICPLGADGREWGPCVRFRGEFDPTTPGSPARRAVLSHARIVQLSFWSFNRGGDTVALDDVAIDGPRLPAPRPPVEVSR
jgi:hypothetical protein